MLREEATIDGSECYLAATFASAKGGGDEIGLATRKGVKIMAIVDRHGLPLATHAANNYEITLVLISA